MKQDSLAKQHNPSHHVSISKRGILNKQNRLYQLNIVNKRVPSSIERTVSIVDASISCGVQSLQQIYIS